MTSFRQQNLKPTSAYRAKNEDIRLDAIALASFGRAALSDVQNVRQPADSPICIAGVSKMAG
jgi:hypothetical protein